MYKLYITCSWYCCVVTINSGRMVSYFQLTYHFVHHCWFDCNIMCTLLMLNLLIYSLNFLDFNCHLLAGVVLVEQCVLIFLIVFNYLYEAGSYVSLALFCLLPTFLLKIFFTCFGRSRPRDKENWLQFGVIQLSVSNIFSLRHLYTTIL